MQGENRDSIRFGSRNREIMNVDRRQVYSVLSPRALPYAGLCLRSLLNNATEPLSLTLITDSPEDKATLRQTLEQIAPDPRHTWTVFDGVEADERAAARFGSFPHVRQFRKGNPCWRKITDPPLFAADGQEMIILDPDVYFPNPFRFEETPRQGLLLMWHPTNCLYPPDVVRNAIRAGIRMADHVDIGVCHIANPLEWEWLDRLIERLGGSNLPSFSMHIESIVWAALAMRMGGGHLDPRVWFCWHNTVWKRLRARRLGASGLTLLRDEPIRGVKCFHACSLAKWWLADAVQSGLFQLGGPQVQTCSTLPFHEYSRYRFERKQLVRAVAQALGIRKVVGEPT
jgi:hypothetical protein